MSIQYSQRLTILGITAWMSLCLMVIGWWPEWMLELTPILKLTGLAGLVASFGLAHVVRRELELHQQVIELMRQQAERDPLTGVANRMLFDRDLTSRLHQSRTESEPFVLCLLDIDHFKSINDVYGHRAGDAMIRCVARGLVTYFGSKTNVARFGGDEFALIMPHTKLEVALPKLHGFLHHMQQNAGLDPALPLPTITIGACEVVDGDSIIQIIDQADRALYWGKQQGRCRVAYWQPEGCQVYDDDPLAPGQSLAATA